MAQDIAAKIVCILQALVAQSAHADANLSDSQRASPYARTALKPLIPILLGGKIGSRVGKLLRYVLDLISGRTYRHRENLSRPHEV